MNTRETNSTRGFRYKKQQEERGVVAGRLSVSLDSESHTDAHGAPHSGASAHA